MTFYTGQPYIDDAVSIAPPKADFFLHLSIDADVRESVENWFSDAATEGDILYFAISNGQSLVGQILLHDINLGTGESLVAYHLFEQTARGKGIGTRALRLLQTYVKDKTDLKKPVIITSRDNPASQRIAQKCGFTYVGESREDPENGMVFEWVVDDPT